MFDLSDNCNNYKIIILVRLMYLLRMPTELEFSCQLQMAIVKSVAKFGNFEFVDAVKILSSKSSSYFMMRY